MQNRKSSSEERRERMLNRYLCMAGEDLLSRRMIVDVPCGWVEIVSDLFGHLRRSHPGTRIAMLHMDPPKYGYSSRFQILFVTPDKKTAIPRSLRWIETQVRKKALATCVECGRPLGRLNSRNRCSICACKDGVRSFD